MKTSLAAAMIVATLLSGCETAGSSDQTGMAGTWFDTLPDAIRESLLWTADHENGDLSDWEDAGTDDYYAGGGVFCTPGPGEPGAGDVAARIVTNTVHSGDTAVAATITNAVRGEHGSRAVRLMRWTDRPWNEDGSYFPRDAYYSTWVYFPERYDPRKFPPWDPGDGGWWNIFQFKSDNDAGSQPVAVVNVWWNESRKQMELYLDTKSYPDSSSSHHTTTTFEQSDPLPLPVARWFHLEARFVKGGSGDGSITVWQDGIQILDASGVTTQLSDQTAWGIGNYTDHIVPLDEDGVAQDRVGDASVYFDDAAVSTRRISEIF